MTATARAEYVISATDKTRQAVESIKGGMKSLDSTVGSIKKTFNALGAVAGFIGLKNSFKGIVQAGANLREELDSLNVSLTDDQARAVDKADAGFTKLQTMMKSVQLTILTALGPTIESLAGFLAEYLPRAIDFGARAFQGLRDLLLSGVQKIANGLGWFYDVLGNLPGSLGETYRDTAKSVHEFAANIGGLREMYESTVAPASAFTFQVKEQTKALDGYLKKLNPQTQLEMERGFKWIEEMQKRSNRDPYKRSGINAQTQLEMERNFEWIEEQAKSSAKGMTVYWDEAARNMQDAFANFLFDPFQDGIRGMLKGFVDTLRRMVAEAAAAKIFDGLFGKKSAGGGGLGSMLGSFFGGLFGGAKAGGGSVSAGKLYRVNENGTEYFKPAGDGQVIPIGGGGGQGTVVHVEIRNDNRGASADFQKVAPALFKQQAEQIEAKIIDGLRRKRYAGV